MDAAARTWLAEGPPGRPRRPPKAASLPARWAACLRTGRGILEAVAADLRKLACMKTAMKTAMKTILEAVAADLRKLQAALQAWTQPLRAPEAKAAFRTCFRLEPPVAAEADPLGTFVPSPDQETWSLHFLLQATDDLSLLVPAERVWKERRPFGRPGCPSSRRHPRTSRRTVPARIGPTLASTLQRFITS